MTSTRGGLNYADIMSMHQLQFLFCDFNNCAHAKAVVQLINAYKQDPMGGSVPFSDAEGHILLKGLASHPSCFVMFGLYENVFASMATCFVNYSTFRLAPYINIHDLIVLDAYRGKGIGRAILQKLLQIAAERGYCKVNLEVREDNYRAKTLYANLGFTECEPPMHFWERLV